MDLEKTFMDEFGKLSQDIQGNELQGKIQMFFRMKKQKVAQEELAETFGVKVTEIDAAMENFKVLGVAEEVEENGMTVYLYRGYPPDMKEIVSFFPDRKKRLETSVKTLEQAVEEERQRGSTVDAYSAVLADIRRDFGIS